MRHIVINAQRNKYRPIFSFSRWNAELSRCTEVSGGGWCEEVQCPASYPKPTGPGGSVRPSREQTSREEKTAAAPEEQTTAAAAPEHDVRALLWYLIAVSALFSYYVNWLLTINLGFFWKIKILVEIYMFTEKYSLLF